jgi:hypothetical protein
MSRSGSFRKASGAPKTVLFVSPSHAHRRLYGPQLSKHFHVECLSQVEGLATRAHAVVYDLEDGKGTIVPAAFDLINLPMVVLTSKDETSLPRAKNRCVLTYPVRLDDILRALERLGVRSDKRSGQSG